MLIKNVFVRRINCFMIATGVVFHHKHLAQNEDNMPDFKIEDSIGQSVAGIDEAGRGPWAGPVVAGAVVFLQRDVNQALLDGLDDSKKLTAKKRELLYDLLFEEQAKGKLAIGIGSASCREIDDLNILQATFEAMRRAYNALSVKPETALIDGNQNPKNFPCRTRTVIKGDALSLSISAASIVAKVYRDRLMKDLALQYPWYAFEKNAGYGTAAHIAGLKTHGVCPEHRRSYKPIQAILNQEE